MLLGDGESPHLLKWARALAPQVELWVASSRGFSPAFEPLVPSWRRLALGGQSDHAGGNIGLLKTLPRLTGRSNRVIITEYALPRPLTTQPHDVILDPEGMAWFTYFDEPMLGFGCKLLGQDRKSVV